jgi:hypothetical protein
MESVDPNILVGGDPGDVLLKGAYEAHDHVSSVLVVSNYNGFGGEQEE